MGSSCRGTPWRERETDYGPSLCPAKCSSTLGERGERGRGGDEDEGEPAAPPVFAGSGRRSSEQTETDETGFGQLTKPGLTKPYFVNATKPQLTKHGSTKRQNLAPEPAGGGRVRARLPCIRKGNAVLRPETRGRVRVMALSRAGRGSYPHRDQHRSSQTDMVVTGRRSHDEAARPLGLGRRDHLPAAAAWRAARGSRGRRGRARRRA